MAELSLALHGTTREAAARRSELAEFLRSRRERISPDRVGLPSGGRRRTPGLRREEVATLAGVGVTWYTWLEQGRDIAPSVQVLDALARTLLLDRHERAHVFTLAGHPDPNPQDGTPVLPAGVHRLLEQLEPMPAVVRNARYDVLAYNRTYRFMIDDLETIPPDERNSLWVMFTYPKWRAALPDFADGAPRLVAALRSAMAGHVAEPAWKCLVKRLCAASPEFEELWQRHDVQAAERMVKRIDSPRVGTLHIETVNAWLDQRLGWCLVTYTPIDAGTREKLEQLAAMVADEPPGRPLASVHPLAAHRPHHEREYAAVGD
jgi:transcriptional regulator with XRE-family HTH domain